MQGKALEVTEHPVLVMCGVTVCYTGSSQFHISYFFDDRFYIYNSILDQTFLGKIFHIYEWDKSKNLKLPTSIGKVR